MNPASGRCVRASSASRSLGIAIALAAIAGMASTGCDDEEPLRVRAFFGMETPSTPIESLNAEISYPSSGRVSVSNASEGCRAYRGIDQATFVDAGHGTLYATFRSDAGFPFEQPDDPDGAAGNTQPDDDPKFQPPDDQMTNDALSSEPARDLAVVDMFDCTFDLPGAPMVEDFSVTVSDARDVDGGAIAALPRIVLTDLEVVSPMGGTTTTTFTDSEPGSVSYAVTFGVTNAVGRLGALQFDVYTRFAGGLRCSVDVPAALASFNAQGDGTLRAALIDLDGFPTPGAVATCSFHARGEVTADDFDVVLVDASDPETNRPFPEPIVAVVALRRAE